MIREIVHNGITVDEHARKAIDRKIQKLEAMLEKFQPDMVKLRMKLNKLNKREEYTVDLILELPNKTLRASKSGDKLSKALNESFNSLIREVKKFKAFLRREPDYKRKIRPTYKEMLLKTTTPEETQELYLDFIEKNFQRFYNFAYREIRNRIYQGLLKPGELMVQDVLDEAILKISEEVEPNFDEKQVRKRVYQAIETIIKRKVKEVRFRRVPLEKTVEIHDLDTELYEYYQPDDVVKVEDVIPDPTSPEPEDWYEEEEIEETVDRVISLLPNRWRQALQLVEMEGFSPEEVAMIQGVPAEQVKQEVENAKQFIREKLQDYGLKWNR